MSPTDQPILEARRVLLALFGFGLLLTFFGAASSGFLLYLYWTRAPNETVPAWQAWQYPCIQGSFSFLILFTICFINFRLLKQLTQGANT